MLEGVLERWGEDPASWALSDESPCGSTRSGLGLSEGGRSCCHPSPPHPRLGTPVKWLSLLEFPASFLPVPLPSCALSLSTEAGEHQSTKSPSWWVTPHGVCLFLELSQTIPSAFLFVPLPFRSCLVAASLIKQFHLSLTKAQRYPQWLSKNGRCRLSGPSGRVSIWDTGTFKMPDVV